VIIRPDQSLIDIARPLMRPVNLGLPDWDAATVACAIRSVTGKVYTGVCIHLNCGLGFCAEHAAGAEMIKGGETQIETLVALCEDHLMAPCGRCREFLIQLNPDNADARILLDSGAVLLRELMPRHWLIRDPEPH
jgi:cytidine deaminase